MLKERPPASMGHASVRKTSSAGQGGLWHTPGFTARFASVCLKLCEYVAHGVRGCCRVAPPRSSKEGGGMAMANSEW